MTLPEPRVIRLALLVLILLVIAGLFVRAQFMDSRRNPFDFWDLLLDHGTNRASLDSTITVVCCAVGVWYAIARATDQAFDPNGGAGTFLLQLIGIMVIYRGVKKGAEAYVARGPSPPPDPPQVSAPGATVIAEAAAPQKSAPLPPAIQTRIG